MRVGREGGISRPAGAQMRHETVPQGRMNSICTGICREPGIEGVRIVILHIPWCGRLLFSKRGLGDCYYDRLPRGRGLATLRFAYREGRTLSSWTRSYDETGRARDIIR